MATRQSWSLVLLGLASLGTLPAQYFLPGPSLSIPQPGGISSAIYSHLLGDFDGDGRVDLILIPGNSMGGSLVGAPVLFYGDVIGGFGPPAISALSTVGGLDPQGRLALHRADLNGDSVSDVIARDSSGRLFAYLGNGSGGLLPQPPSGINSPIQAKVLDIEDVDGDGDDDLLISASSGFFPPNRMEVLINGGGTWSTSFSLESRGGIQGRFGEFDGDGITDLCYRYLAASAQWSYPVTQYLVFRQGNPGGGFSGETWIFAGRMMVGPIPPPPLELIEVTDLDFDGLSEILYSRQAPVLPPTIEHLVGSLDPATSAYSSAVAAAVTYSLVAPSWPVTPVLGRFSGGLRRDVLSGVNWCRGTPNCVHNPALHLQAGPGLFIPSPVPESLPISGSAPLYEASDFDGDGDADLMAHSIWAGSQFFEVFTNRAISIAGCQGAMLQSSISSPPATGRNATYRLSNAPPAASCVLGLATRPGSGSATTCAPGIDLTALVLPTTSGLGVMLADSSGTAQQLMVIPPLPALQGLEVWSQWAALDPAGPLMTPAGSMSLSSLRYSVIL